MFKDNMRYHEQRSMVMDLWSLTNGWFCKTVLLLLLSHFSHVRLCDPIDGSPPGPAVLGILQARTLEWVAISSSNACKWKVKVKSLSRVQLLATPWTAAYQAPLSMGFSRQEYWSGMPLRKFSSYHCFFSVGTNWKWGREHSYTN